jgi:hypothetical protein
MLRGWQEDDRSQHEGNPGREHRADARDGGRRPQVLRIGSSCSDTPTRSMRPIADLESSFGELDSETLPSGEPRWEARLDKAALKLRRSGTSSRDPRAVSESLRGAGSSTDAASTKVADMRGLSAVSTLDFRTDDLLFSRKDVFARFQACRYRTRDRCSGTSAGNRRSKTEAVGVTLASRKSRYAGTFGLRTMGTAGFEPATSRVRCSTSAAPFL